MARSTLATLAVAILVLAANGCGRKTPAEVKPILDAQRATALKVADDAAKLCPSVKANAPFNPNPMAAPPPPPTPAKNTSLETEAKVVDVFIMCSWPDPRSPGVTGGTSLPSLKNTSHVQVRPVTMPEDKTEDTCRANPKSCEQVISPSRHSPNEKSADLRIVRPTPDGGEVEVRVIIVP